jgi:DNA (cytosine-5)-methyltransferase 1
MTDDTIVIRVQELLGVCHVRVYSAVSHNLSEWLSGSPDHFYVKYFFPSLVVRSWAQRRNLNPVRVCADCCLAKEKEMDSRKLFSLAMEKHPICGLDLCAGSGAFGKAMEASGCVKFKYAVEISPSACKTLRFTF